MDALDSKILLVARDKRKIKVIRQILARPGNFERDQAEGFYRIHSTSTEKVYEVYRVDTAGFKCNCVYNWRFKEYRPGMKRHGKNVECIHILALKVWILLKS